MFFIERSGVAADVLTTLRDYVEEAEFALIAIVVVAPDAGKSSKRYLTNKRSRR